MKAKYVGGEGSGGKRTPLSQVLPLDTPYALYLFPIYACNFKCNYCYRELEDSLQEFDIDIRQIDLNLVSKCMEQIKTFPNNIKLMKIAGLGEPLLYKDIDKIVKYAVDSKKIDKVEIITNGSLLERNLSERLIEAGLKRLTISIQGTSARKYKEICGVDIDFDKFLSNIRYFYDIKQDAEVRIKIIDAALDNKEDEKLYFEMFGDMCDYIAIEHLIPSSFKNKKVSDTVTVHGTKVENCNICSLPFYMLQLHPDGKVLACCNCESPHYFGNCNTESLYDIWNSNTLNHFRYKMLCGIEQMKGYCNSCISKDYVTFPEDKIDKHTADRLKYILNKII